MIGTLPPWESLRLRILWKQLEGISGKRILDFGSGTGVTANHFAVNNDVVAIEPSEDSIRNRWREHKYRQICGSTEVLQQMEDASFDVIFCHNVLEYAQDREIIIREFHRVLKADGILSVMKHNRAGRVMQMMVLLDDFDRANALLDGENSRSGDYGTIHYYADEDIVKWCPRFQIQDVRGVCTFWRLQQKQELHPDPEWQRKMAEIDMRVSDIDEYRNIAFFHHLILQKR